MRCVLAIALSLSAGCLLFPGEEEPPALDAGRSDPDAPAQPQPILRYTFDNTAENSGSLAPAHAGTATATTYVLGRNGHAIQFQETLDSVVTLADTAALLATRPQLTIGLWFREDAVSPDTGFVRYLLDNRCCFMQPDRGFQAYHGVSGAPLTTCSAAGCRTIDYAVGDWHQLLYRYDATAGGAIEIFLDGQPIATIDNPEGIPIFGPGVADLRVGFNSNFMVDDLEVWDVVLPVRGD